VPHGPVGTADISLCLNRPWPEAGPFACLVIKHSSPLRTVSVRYNKTFLIKCENAMYMYVCYVHICRLCTCMYVMYIYVCYVHVCMLCTMHKAALAAQNETLHFFGGGHSSLHILSIFGTRWRLCGYLHAPHCFTRYL
jgi:hypothetical protein